ncbi:MAG: hypothetical protein V2B15_12555 [Bacteroidota bacterium]
MKKILNLEAKDFPNVDPVKFQEWKDAQVKFRKQSNIASAIIFAGILILLLFREQFLPAMVFGVTIIVGVIIMVPPYRKVKKTQKEAGLTAKDIRKAQRE